MRWRKFPVVLAVIAGCASPEVGSCGVGPVGNGELGNGTFGFSCPPGVGREFREYEYCNPSSGIPPIGVGATFQLTYGIGDSMAGVTLLPASTEYVGVQGTAFLAKQAGQAAIIARGLGKTDVVDLIHLSLLDPTSLEIAFEGPASPLPREGSTRLGAVVRAASTTPGAPGRLGGQFTVAWSSSDESIVSVAAPDLTKYGLVTLTANKVGTATITATLGALVASQVITVTPGYPDPDDLDAGADAADGDARADASTQDSGANDAADGE